MKILPLLDAEVAAHIKNREFNELRNVLRTLTPTDMPGVNSSFEMTEAWIACLIALPADMARRISRYGDSFRPSSNGSVRVKASGGNVRPPRACIILEPQP